MAIEDKYLKESTTSLEYDADEIINIEYKKADTCFTCMFSTGGCNLFKCKNKDVIKNAILFSKINPILIKDVQIYISKDSVCKFFKEE